MEKKRKVEKNIEKNIKSPTSNSIHYFKRLGRFKYEHGSC